MGIGAMDTSQGALHLSSELQAKRSRVTPEACSLPFPTIPRGPVSPLPGRLQLCVTDLCRGSPPGPCFLDSQGDQNRFLGGGSKATRLPLRRACGT